VKSSLSNLYGGPRERPRLNLEEEAFQLVQLIESNSLTDTKVFTRNVLSNMLFTGVPPEFLPILEDDDEA
jgi:hypothetical protein